MCGINVVQGLCGQKVSVADLQRMCSVIGHRGPDGGGFVLLNQGTLGLAHVRLSVIDLATGTQPLSSADGQVTIVFNGELYDYRRHRKSLEKAGHHFRTASDTEVLLHMYLEHGTECFERLNGEFAFVIWDGRSQRLIAVRDRFGVKPLFFHKTADELFFVSEIKSLFTLPRVKRSFHPDYFVSAFFGTFTPQTHLYEHIQPLPPGHYICVEGRVWSPPKPYWRPTFATDTSMTLQEASEGVRNHFLRAVSRRMVADVPVGTHLSGGIDSTLVCGVMSQLSTKVRSFNVGFGNTIFDESSLARRIAEYYGSEFETVDCDSEQLANNFKQTVWHVEQPLMNPNSIAKYILSRLIRNQGYKVCLTGEGADELFGGYPYFKQELLWEMETSEQPDDIQLAKVLLKKFYQIEKRSEGHHWNRDITGQGPLPGYLRRANFYYSRMRASKRYVKQLFTKSLLRTASVKSPLEYFERTFDTASLEPLPSFNATKLMTYQLLSGYIFPCVGDRVDMANSVECRIPFLDPELVEFTSRIPPQHFMDIKNLREKNLLRLGFRDMLPPFIASEHKHPFMSPSWYRLYQTRSGREQFSELLAPNVVREVGIFRPSFVAVSVFLWRTLPQWTTLWRRIDTAIGQVCSVHLLYQIMLKQPEAGEPRFRLMDCTPQGPTQSHARAS